MHAVVANTEPSLTGLLVDAIEARGHTVSVVECASEVLEAVAAEQPALLLLDWHLPGMEPLELCGRIRARSGGAELVILVIMDGDRGEELAAVFEAGASDCLFLPLDADALDARLALAETVARRQRSAASRRRGTTRTPIAPPSRPGWRPRKRTDPYVAYQRLALPTGRSPTPGEGLRAGLIARRRRRTDPWSVTLPLPFPSSGAHAEAAATMAAPIPEPIVEERSLRLAVPASARRGRVLVVDDQTLVLAALRRLLSREHEVLIVGSAEEALELLVEREFDVILCDLSLPGMDGIDFYLELVRNAPSLAERTFFITAGASSPRTCRFLDEHRDRCFEKPFDAQAISALIRARLQ